MRFDTGKWTIQTILRMHGGKEIVLQPDYQRFYIWDSKKEQGLIDTILREYPVPPIWVWRHFTDGKKSIYEIIDGQQRLTCIKRYLANEFPFQPIADSPGAEQLDEAKNKYFDKVPPGIHGKALKPEHRNRILDYQIPFVEVKTEDRWQIIDIFKRLNKSSTNLNPQELRNAFFTGEFKSSVYKVTAKLQDDRYWGSPNRVFTKPTTDRMANQQFVSDLYVAMIASELQHQSTRLDEYYEQYDSIFKNKKQIEKRFEDVLKIMRGIFPDSSRFTRNQSDFYTVFLYLDEIATGSNIPIDKKNIDVIGESLSQFEQKYAEYLELRGTHGGTGIFEEYRETIVGRQREKEVREKRREIIQNLIEPGLVRRNLDSQRVFSDEQREYIWQTSIDKKCGICRKKIESYDDYEPDHKIPWSKGGRTSIGNGQVSHRSCNRKKQAKYES